MPNPRTLSHKSSFIPRTFNLWNVLPSCFPESYNLPSFKSKINKIHLISLSSEPFNFFFLPFLLGLFTGHHGPFPNMAFPKHNSLKNHMFQTSEGYYRSKEKPTGYPNDCLICKVEVKDRPYHILPKLKEEWEYYEAYKEGIRYFNEVSLLFEIFAHFIIRP